MAPLTPHPGPDMDIRPYTYANAERLQFGAFPVLDAVLNRWARRTEETLFDLLRTELYAGASVFEEMKFGSFYASLKRPRPIYTFSLEPFRGRGLLVLDNRFSHFCLDPRGTRGDAAGRLGPQNHQRLQRVVQRMMADFDACWRDVEPVHARLHKLSTYLFRARILNPYERCLVAQIHLSGEGVSSRLTWCLPRVMLEPLLHRLRSRRVIPPVGLPAEGESEGPGERTALAERLGYRLRVSLGRIGPEQAARGLHVGSVIPLQNDAQGNAVLSVHDAPMLVGRVGEVQGRYAVEITAPYAAPPRLPLPSAAAFHPIRWPEIPA